VLDRRRAKLQRAQATAQTATDAVADLDARLDQNASQTREHEAALQAALDQVAALKKALKAMGKQKDKLDAARKEVNRFAIERPSGLANIVVLPGRRYLVPLSNSNRIAEYDRHIASIAKESAQAAQLMQLPGVGPTTATALIAMIGRGQDFKCGRQLSAWLGLVPGQYSSGGKQRLGRITKAGDPYLRMLLILGARSVLQNAASRSDAVSRWAVQLAARVGYWKAIVAIAAKNARMCWAVLARGEAFKLPA
jgi:transposase